MKKYGIIIVLAFVVAACTGSVSQEDYLSYVDTRVGTASATTSTAGLFGKGSEEHGQTIPAVGVPHGMNLWTPQTRTSEAKCVAPYYYADSTLLGFRNSHWIVGGCTQDYGSMTLAALAGKLRTAPESRATKFSHGSETARPDYYSVSLPEENIEAEMTGLSRAAIFNFNYTADGTGHIVVNSNSDEGEGYVAVDSERHEIYGCNPVHRIYQGWGQPAGFSGYFVVRLEPGIEISGSGIFAADSTATDCNSIAGTTDMGAFFSFNVKAGTTVQVKAASSFTSVEAARANLEAEIPGWDFNEVRAESARQWNERLGRITVEGGTEADRRKFYGSLYRASLLPRVVNDADGSYAGFAGSGIKHLGEGEEYYDDFSMWDTYRALHPLVTLLSPSRSGEMMQSLVIKARQGGWMPIFPCWNSYTSAMIGDHCIAAICDAYVKGVRNFDIDTAYSYMRKNAFESPADSADYKNGMGRRALRSYLKYGYIPLEDSVKEAFHQCEQVSRTLEYAFDDFALAQAARMLGKEEDARILTERSKNYVNVIDPSTGYAQGRHADGTFLRGGNEFGFTKFITEGAPCHYTWYAPHDVGGLMKAMGGRGAFTAKLDSMFTQRRYWHGNEPCHQMAWMFNYAGQPWRTQKEVRHIMTTEYFNSPGGLSGNDDAGQMSAWYVFAALGFYPVAPGTPYYMLGSPSFPKAVIHLEDGKEFTIIAEGASPENIYIQSATLNGKPYDKNYINHFDITAGGVLELVMGPEPNPAWGSSEQSCLVGENN